MPYYQGVTVYFDGASRNNPKGPAGCGWVIYDDDGNQLARGRSYLAYGVSNNQAEYEGLEQALHYLAQKNIGCEDLEIKGDSEVVIKQLKGEYQVRSSNIRGYYDAVKTELNQVGASYVTYTHIRRTLNTEADKLANNAIRKRSGYVSD